MFGTYPVIGVIKVNNGESGQFLFFNFLDCVWTIILSKDNLYNYLIITFSIVSNDSFTFTVGKTQSYSVKLMKYNVYVHHL